MILHVTLPYLMQQCKKMAYIEAFTALALILWLTTFSFAGNTARTGEEGRSHKSEDNKQG